MNIAVDFNFLIQIKFWKRGKTMVCSCSRNIVMYAQEMNTLLKFIADQHKSTLLDLFHEMKQTMPEEITIAKGVNNFPTHGYRELLRIAFPDSQPP